MLAEALARGADYVDVEWCAGSDFLLAAEHGRRIVLSIHDFDRVPADLEARYRAMRATGAEVVKVAVQSTASRTWCGCVISIVMRLAADRSASSSAWVRLACRRVSCPDRFGSAWTYAGEGVAPGQIGLERMVTEFRVRDLGSDARLYGVLGSPLAHSLSPAMHNAGFTQLGLDAVYLPLQASDVEDFEIFARAFDVAGASVTAPCKEAAMTLVADPDTLCRRAGAVNTLRAAGDRWEGRNTDIPGFLDALCAEHGRDLSGWRASFWEPAAPPAASRSHWCRRVRR